jgi:hypothetical protein
MFYYNLRLLCAQFVAILNAAFTKDGAKMNKTSTVALRQAREFIDLALESETRPQRLKYIDAAIRALEDAQSALALR